MKAKNLGRNLQGTLNGIKRGFKMRRFRVMHRTHLNNDEVRYLTHSGSMMFVQEGEHMQITFKSGYTSAYALLGNANAS